MQFDDKIIALYPHLGGDETAKILDLTKKQVMSVANRLGLKLNPDVKTKIMRASAQKRSDQKTDYRFNYDEFTSIDSPVKALVWGLLWADGNIYRNKGHQNIVFSTTFPDSEYFVPLFMSTGYWRSYRYKNKNNPTWRDSVRVITNSKFMTKKMSELGFEERYRGFDRIFSFIPKEYLRFWCLGMSDGDGCFYVNVKEGAYRFSFCSCYEQDWSTIEKLMQYLNIRYKLIRATSDKGNCSKIIIDGKYEVKKWGDFLYSDHDLGLPRKRAKFEEINSRCKPFGAPDNWFASRRVKTS